MNNNPFTPMSHGSLSVAASAAATNPTPAPWGATQVRVYNSGSALARLEFGSVADANSMPIPAGAIEVFSIPANGTYSLIAPAGDTTVELTFGMGA